MASTNKTVNYNLSQFSDDDKPSWRGDYNGDMTRIDKGLDTVATATNSNTKRIEEVKNVADSAQSTANTGVQSAQTAQNTADNAISILNGASLKSADDGKNMRSEIRGKADANTVYTKADVDGTFATKASVSTKAEKVDVYTKDESDRRFAPLTTAPVEQTIMVGIGDSYGYGTGTSSVDNRFFKIIGKELGLDVRNYAGDGGGWLHDGTADMKYIYATELQNAYDDLKNDINKVKIVLIQGGRNDVNYHSSSETYSAVNSTLTNAKKLFPNSRIIVAPMQWGAEPIPQNAYDHYEMAVRACEDSRVEVIKGAWTWLKGEFGSIIGDGIHPNDQGNRQIAGYLLQGIRGQNTYAVRYGVAASNKAFKIVQNDCRFENGLVTICVRVAKADGTNWNGNETFAFLPEFCNVAHSTEYAVCGKSNGETCLVGISNSPQDHKTLLTNFAAHADQSEIFVQLTYGCAY